MISNSTVLLTRLLEEAKRQLSQPFANRQRILLIYLNITYLFLAPLFLISEKLATDHYVPHVFLGYTYLFVAVTNCYSAVYNILLLKGITRITLFGKVYELRAEDKIDFITRWLSMVSLMFMSFLNMTGFGNPSSDSILTDFALGHSLIVLTAVLIGRRVAFLWFLVVLGSLFYTTFRIGYTHQYNYLTPAESVRYEMALQKETQWALKRQTTLREIGLNPPLVSRYFNTWIIFILIAFLTAYFFASISLDMLKIIPTVTQNIANAIETVNSQELEREREKNLAEEQKLLLKQESLHAELNFLKSQINPHFLYNTLSYLYIRGLEYSEELADSIMKVSDIMRYSLRADSDFVLIDEEITYMKDFIAIHQLRNKNKLHILFTIDGMTEKKTIIPFILISLLENGFKHGVLDDEQFPLTLTVSCDATSIRFYMSNKKNERPLIDSTHIGLANIQRRLDLSYPSSHTFKIEQDQDTFKCWLLITA